MLTTIQQPSSVSSAGLDSSLTRGVSSSCVVCEWQDVHSDCSFVDLMQNATQFGGENFTRDCAWEVCNDTQNEGYAAALLSRCATPFSASVLRPWTFAGGSCWSTVESRRMSTTCIQCETRPSNPVAVMFMLLFCHWVFS